MLENLQFEIVDLKPAYTDLLEAFAGSTSELTLDDTRLQLGLYADLEEPSEADEAIDTLIRYGFFGIRSSVFRTPTYAFSSNLSFSRLRYALHNDDGSMVIHPAFRRALEIVTS